MSDQRVLDSGINLEELDPAVRPQDDLFRHVNGKWINRTEIPADKARYGSFMILAEQAEEAVREIITGLDAPAGEAKTEAQKIAALYKSFKNTELLDELGAKPIEGDIKAALSTDSIADFTELT